MLRHINLATDIADGFGDARQGDTILRGDRVRHVIEVKIHEAHAHGEFCPIEQELVAVEIVTSDGSRWVGVQHAEVDEFGRTHWRF